MNGLKLGISEKAANPDAGADGEDGEGGSAGAGGRKGSKKPKIDSSAAEMNSVRLATGYCPVDLRTIKNDKTKVKFNMGPHVHNLGSLIASKEDLGKRLKLWYTSHGLEVVSGPVDRDFDEDEGYGDDQQETDGAVYGSTVTMRLRRVAATGEEDEVQPGEAFSVKLDLRTFFDYYNNKAHSALNTVPHSMSSSNGNTVQMMDANSETSRLYRIINQP
jgi:hypothetical protein